MNARNPHRRQHSRVYPADIEDRRRRVKLRTIRRAFQRRMMSPRIWSGFLTLNGYDSTPPLRRSMNVVAGEELRAGDMVTIGSYGKARRVRPDTIFMHPDDAAQFKSDLMASLRHDEVYL